MKKAHVLFAVYGTSGSGKSALLNLARKMYDNVSIHRKDSDRKPRSGEKKEGTPELRFVDRLKEKDYELIYSKYGNKYGIRKDLLREAFANKELHFIIIADIDALKAFREVHPRTIILYVHTDPDTIPARFKNRDTLEFQRRKTRLMKNYYDFIDNNTLFDHVILNFWELDNAAKQLGNIIEFYLK